MYAIICLRLTPTPTVHLQFRDHELITYRSFEAAEAVVRQLEQNPEFTDFNIVRLP